MERVKAFLKRKHDMDKVIEAALECAKEELA